MCNKAVDKVIFIVFTIPESFYCMFYAAQTNPVSAFQKIRPRSQYIEKEDLKNRK